MTLGAFIGALLAALFTPLAVLGAQAPAPSPLLAEASKKLAARDYSGCVEALNAMLTVESPTPDAYVIRGRCAAGQDHHEVAIADYGRALALNPRAVRALYYRAVSRSQLAEFADAVSDFGAALAIDSSFAEAYGGRAGTRRLVGDARGALDDLDQALRLQPGNPVLYHLRGCLLYDNHAWDMALRDFREAISRDPDGQPLSRARMWLIHARRGNRRQASRDLVQFLDRSSPKDQEAWERNILLFLVGRRSETDLLTSAATSEPAVTRVRRAQASFYVGTMRLLNRDLNGARQHLQEVTASGRRSLAEYQSAQHEIAQLDGGRRRDR